MSLGPPGRPKLIVIDASNAVHPSWSHDGRTIYFSSDRSGDWELWRTPIDEGRPIQITHHGGWESFETVDSRTLFFTKRNQPGLWRLSLAAGNSADRNVLNFGENGRWALGRDAFYFMADSEEQPWKFELMRLRLRDQKLSRVLALPHRVCLPLEPSVSVSYDGKLLAYAGQETPQSDIMLITKFR